MFTEKWRKVKLISIDRSIVACEHTEVIKWKSTEWNESKMNVNKFNIYWNGRSKQLQNLRLYSIERVELPLALCCSQQLHTVENTFPLFYFAIRIIFNHWWYSKIRECKSLLAFYIKLIKKQLSRVGHSLSVHRPAKWTKRENSATVTLVILINITISMRWTKT